MAADLVSLVGEANMTPAAKEAVIQIIQLLPADALQKRYLFARWARLVGFQATPADIDRVALWSQG